MTNNDILKDCFAVFTCTCYTVHGKALYSWHFLRDAIYISLLHEEANKYNNYRTFDQQSVLFRIAGTVSTVLTE